MFRTLVLSIATAIVTLAGGARAAGVVDRWPMAQRDPQHTGRSNFTVPESRQNSSFFDVFTWQRPSPDSPNDGRFGATQMTYADDAGPGGADLVVGAYHWPKGVMGLDRRTGRAFWWGNPGGGESIGGRVPAFANDSHTIYVTNDATDDGTWPLGHPLMAISATAGPGTMRHNGANASPAHLGNVSPVVALSDRIYLHEWDGTAYAATDDGSALNEVWAAASGGPVGLADVSLIETGDTTVVVSATRWGEVIAHDAGTGAELWRQDLGKPFEASPTIDPASGQVYVTGGNHMVELFGFDRRGNALWNGSHVLLYSDQYGSQPQERVWSAGCLSADGTRCYVQTASAEGTGALYAVDVVTGTLAWRLPTRSMGWDEPCSSPIVTPNGVLVVGNNRNLAYYAVRDDGASATVLDSLVVDGANEGAARATATLSDAGDLYLPLRTAWTAGNGDGQAPDLSVQNLFCSIDLRAGATPTLPPPPGPIVWSRNAAAALRWRMLPDPSGVFDHYAVYRETQPFATVAGLTPVATFAVRSDTTWTDTGLANGTSYWYAVTAVSTGGAESAPARVIGPRIPRDETDLQVAVMTRTPRYPRYLPEYAYHEVTEPGGFGPYGFSAATGLGGGQTEATKHLPAEGELVTWTVTVRNRGTNTWPGAVHGRFTLAGVSNDVTASGPVPPGGRVTFTKTLPWTAATSQTLEFRVLDADARAANNVRSVDTRSVAFLSYVDENFAEDFHDARSPQYPSRFTDDYVDWVHHHMDWFNQMFAAAGSSKRVHQDVLERIPDEQPDPAVDTTPFAVFPFRFHAGADDYRQTAWYRAPEDIDYGYLHEMGHQLGLVDVYQLDVPAEANGVSHTAYTAPTCLMNACADVLSPQSALGMSHWAAVAHGFYGQYLYGLPRTIRMRFLDSEGNPLPGATVKVFQYAERPGLGKVITDQVKFQGTTDAEGHYVLPNVPIDTTLTPPAPTGDTLHANPFGYVAVVATNGVLLFEVTKGAQRDYAWLDITEPNAAFYQGQRTLATFVRRVQVGGWMQKSPPPELTEGNAAHWLAWADGVPPAGTTATDDEVRRVSGTASLKFVTDGGFDTKVRYPGAFLADWNLAACDSLVAWVHAQNANTFQGPNPWMRLVDAGGHTADYQWCQGGEPQDLLTGAIGQWVRLAVPLGAAPDVMDGWRRTDTGAVDLAHVAALEIHADTWDYGFTLWLDGVRFTPAAVTGAPATPALAAGTLRFANPYRPGGTMRFGAGSGGRVRADLFDAGGRRVRTLADRVAAAGDLVLAWDGRDDAGTAVPPGVYFVRVTTAQVATRARLVLLR